MRLHLPGYDAQVQRRVDQLVSSNAAARIWRREPAFWGGEEEQRRIVADRLGWLDVATRMQARLPELDAFCAELTAAGFREAVVLGMGGSSLAPEVLRATIADAAPPARRGEALRLHVLDTTDPATIAILMRAIDPDRTLFFVSSKSGTTIEALSLFGYFFELVRQRKGDTAGENFVAITDSGTALENVGREHGFRRVFINSGDIGGRYSALSYFGLVPAAVAGVDVARLVSRAIAAAEAAKVPDSDALRLGAALGELALAGRDKCTFVAGPAIASFGLWVEQLIAESTGKLGRGILPIAGEPLGSPLRYGDDRLFVQLRLEADSNGQNDAAIGALAAAGFPVVIVEMGDVYDLGREFFNWEFGVAVAGQMLGINPFDEPNVQESKDNTASVLEASAGTPRVETAAMDEASLVALSGSAGVPVPLSQGVATLLGSLHARDYFAITAFVTPTPLVDCMLQDIRSSVRDGWRVATTLGYGPRYLHSTGQLHKGGPPTGVFLELTTADASDLAIPERPFTFGQLRRAQAIGDLQSLIGHGRPVLRVHLGTDTESGIEAVHDAVLAASRAAAVQR